MNKVDGLIYELIFSTKKDFSIDISEYIDNIYDYEKFASNIRQVLKKSKVKIVKSELKLDSRTVIWELKVSK